MRKIIDKFTNLPISRQRKWQLRNPVKIKKIQCWAIYRKKGKAFVCAWKFRVLAKIFLQGRSDRKDLEIVKADIKYLVRG